MKILNIMIGLPGCGKSTFCQNEIAAAGEGQWISRDAIRFSMLKNGQAYFSQETNVFNKFIETVVSCMEQENYILYIDATHLNSSSRLKLLRRLNLKGDEEICYYFFDVPIEECLRRNRLREGLARVPDSAIRDMNARAQFYVTAAEKRAYDPIWYVVDFKGEIVE
jgi:predicted kinase